MKENNTETAIARVPQNNSLSFGDMQTLALSASKSGYFNRLSPEQALIKAMLGREYGIAPASSLSLIHVIQDKPTLSANAMAGLIKASGKYRYTVVEWTNENCQLEFYEKLDGRWVAQGPSSFSLEDAARAGLTTGKNAHTWKSYPRNMLFARAISNGARVYCPDVAMGLYVPEEMGASVDAEGGIIEGEAVQVTPAARPATVADLPAQEKRNGRVVDEAPQDPKAYPGEIWKAASRRMRSAQHEAGYSDEQMKKWVYSEYAVDSSTKLTADQLIEIANQLQRDAEELGKVDEMPDKETVEIIDEAIETQTPVVTE